MREERKRMNEPTTGGQDMDASSTSRSKHRSVKKSSAATSTPPELPALPQHAEAAGINDDILSQVTPRQSNLSKDCRRGVDLAISSTISSGGETTTIPRSLHNVEDIEDTENGLFSLDDEEEDYDDILESDMLNQPDVNVNDDDESEPETKHLYQTRSGRKSKPPNKYGFTIYDSRSEKRRNIAQKLRQRRCAAATVQLIESCDSIADKFYRSLTEEELTLLSADRISEDTTQVETAMVGATGHAYSNTSQLKTLNYKQSMESPYCDRYEQGMDEELYRMVDAHVFKEVDRDSLPRGTKLMSSTWANKFKSNGDVRCRLAIRGYEQIDGVHYDKNDKSSPVVCDVTIRVILILLVMANWTGYILDVKDAFLKGTFSNGKKIFMEIPDGFQKWYPSYIVLQLQRTLYQLIQAALQFWRAIRLAMRSVQLERNCVDPCMFYKWVNGSFVIVLTWIDDFLIAGPDHLIPGIRRDIEAVFDCEDVGVMVEYVGCKVDCNRKERSLKLTQPVKIDKFHDEFGIERNLSRNPLTPAEPNSVLKSEGEGEEDLVLTKQEQKEYRSDTAVLLHMMRWSRVETMNAVRECSRFMTSARNSHMKALKRIMQYVCGTRDRGLFLKPSKWWDGKISTNGRFEFVVNGKSDSEYAKDESRDSVNGWSKWIFDCCVTNHSKMMPVIALSVTEAELYAAVQCAQDLIFIWRLLLSLELEVKLPMILEIDNRGAFDFINGWSVSGRFCDICSII